MNRGGVDETIENSGGGDDLDLKMNEEKGRWGGRKVKIRERKEKEIMGRLKR